MWLNTSQLIGTFLFTAGSALSLFQACLLSYSVFVWTKHFFGNSGFPIKPCVFITGCFWLLAAIFVFLIPLGLFDRTCTTTALLLIACISYYRWRIGYKQLSLELSKTAFAVGNLCRSLRLTTQVLTYTVGAVFLIRFARGLIAPPLAWDALTYHLLKAGRWVQTGRWVSDNAPDAWQFYEWFPPLGDVYWAWAMLGTHTDAWLAVAGALIWLSCGAATYSLARVLGAEHAPAWLAALAAASVPAALALLTANYVDNTAMALVLSGSTLTLAAVKQRSAKSAAAGAVAMALAVGIKITFLPYLLVSSAVLLWLSTTHSNRKFIIFATSLTAIAVSLFWQIYLIVAGKTPFYPAPFSFVGFQIETGMPEFLVLIFPDKFHLPYVWEIPMSVWRFLLETEYYSPTHLNLTWTFPMVLYLGIAGILRLRKIEKRLELLTLLGLFISGFVIFINFWLPSTAYYRGVWLSNMGRFFLPWYSLLLVVGLFFPFRFQTLTYAAVVAVNVYVSFPRSWVALDAIATLAGIFIILGFLLGMRGFINLRRGWVRCAMYVTVIATCISGIIIARDQARYRFYQNTDKVYDVLFLGGIVFPGRAAKIMDQKEPVTINFAADYGGVGYRWFRYVFMGSRLQNNVIYVTPTTDGSTWSRSVTKYKPTDYGLWRKRLIESEVDYIVTIKPFASELGWLAEYPGAFNLVALQQPKNRWAVYEVLPEK